MRPPACGTADQVPPSAVLLRMVRDDPDHLEWDSDRQGWFPKPDHPSNSFQFDPDWSTYWERHLSERHSIDADLLPQERPDYPLVYSVQVSQLPDEVSVEHTPPEDYPIGCAHVSVWLPADALGASKTAKGRRKSIRSKIFDAMELRAGVPSLPPPPGS